VIKLYRLLTRRLDMKHDEAVGYWTEQYAPLLVDALGDRLSKYVTNVGLPVSWDGGPEEAPPWDGIDEFWLDMTREEVRGEFEKVMPKLISSEQAFLGTYQWMLVDEVVQKDDPNRSHTFKLIEPLVRRRDKTWDEFVDFWLNQHAPLVMETWSHWIARYTTNPGLSNPFTKRLPDEGPPYDGIAEFHYDWTMDDYRQSLIDTADVLVPDEVGFVSTWRGLLVEEIVQKEGPTT
jgi:EthD domain